MNPVTAARPAHQAGDTESLHGSLVKDDEPANGTHPRTMDGNEICSRYSLTRASEDVRKTSVIEVHEKGHFESSCWLMYDLGRHQ
jgi:hypothetical protein